MAAAERTGQPEVVCEALDVIARCARSRRLADAADALRRALAVADAHQLAGCRLQALNELGTVEMLATADGTRLRRAREAALAAGALDVSVGISVNLASLHAIRGELDAARDTARRAQAAAARLGMTPLAAAALAVEAAAGADLAAARATGTPGASWSALWLGYGAAALAGASGDKHAAGRAFAAAETAARRHPLFRAIGLRLLAEAALRDQWGEPVSWLRAAEAVFVAGSQDRIAAACRGLLRQAGANVPRRRGADRSLPDDLLLLGVTAREAEVLGLVAERLPNKDIATAFTCRRGQWRNTSRTCSQSSAPKTAGR